MICQHTPARDNLAASAEYAPRVAEMLRTRAPSRVGHKGLFVERLDTTTMLGTERLVSNARLLYHARIRWLQPTP